MPECTVQGLIRQPLRPPLYDIQPISRYPIDSGVNSSSLREIASTGRKHMLIFANWLHQNCEAQNDQKLPKNLSLPCDLLFSCIKAIEFSLATATPSVILFDRFCSVFNEIENAGQCYSPEMIDQASGIATSCFDRSPNQTDHTYLRSLSTELKKVRHDLSNRPMLLTLVIYFSLLISATVCSLIESDYQDDYRRLRNTLLSVAGPIALLKSRSKCSVRITGIEEKLISEEENAQ